MTSDERSLVSGGLKAHVVPAIGKAKRRSQSEREQAPKVVN
jgi:hypothetical protein